MHMKSIFKKYRIFFAAAFLLALFFCCRTLFPAFQLQHKGSESFNNFISRLFADELTSNTMNLHFTLKDPSSMGIDSYEVTFGDFSTKSQKSSAKNLEHLQKELSHYSYRALDAQNKLTYKILEDTLRRQRALAEYPMYEEVVTPSNGVTSQLPILLAEYPFYRKQDVDDYLTLLAQMDTYFSNILSYEEDKAKAGLFMSDKKCMKVIEGCEIFTQHPEDNFLLSTFSNRLDTLNLSDSEKEEYIAKNKQVIAEHVIPAYSEMISGLTKLLGCGRNDWGLCNYEDGKSYYEALVAYNTGTDFTVDELFQQIADARQEDVDICTTILASNPKLASMDIKLDSQFTDENAMIDHLKKAITKDFPKACDTTCEITHVDESLSEYLAPAFYITAPIDDYSTNRIYINNANNYTDLYYFTTLAHEGYPGHLYQTIQSYDYGLPPIRSLFNYPAYTEGWATYVEMLAYYYAGLPKDQASLLQHNQAAMLSLYASSDIGIHYYGWKKADMQKFWKNFGIDDETAIDSITDLVLEDPGNYLKYYVGYLQFRQLRETCEKKYGDKFDASAFHEAILRTGPAPFSIVEEQVKRALR